MRPAKRMGPRFLGLKNKISEIHIKQYQQNVRDSRELFDRKKMCRLAEYIQMTNKSREEERYICKGSWEMQSLTESMIAHQKLEFYC